VASLKPHQIAAWQIILRRIEIIDNPITQEMVKNGLATERDMEIYLYEKSLMADAYEKSMEKAMDRIEAARAAKRN